MHLLMRRRRSYSVARVLVPSGAVRHFLIYPLRAGFVTVKLKSKPPGGGSESWSGGGRGLPNRVYRLLGHIHKRLEVRFEKRKAV